MLSFFNSQKNKSKKTKQKDAMSMWVSRIKSLRIASVILGLSNLVLVIIGGFLMFVAIPGFDHDKVILPLVGVSLFAALRIFVMVKSAIAQEAIAKTIQESLSQTSAIDSIIRLKRRGRYRTWIGWSRCAMVITLLQILGAIYLVFNVAKYISHDGTSNQSFLGMASNGNQWKCKLLVLYVVMACSISLGQCFVGSDVLRWRSFYATQDDFWKAHYHEVFDHGIREVLCCLGSFKYLSVSEEDEVHSVARLLGDLVAYRASGTGHLELLTGLALLQRHSGSSKSYEGMVEASKELIQEAFNFHEFAEAAYTGPLLDFGRHTVFFPCAWAYRQGIFTPWTWNRRPLLKGDNWWRGHAAAFLKYVNLPPEALRRGRVRQGNCKAAYFIVVLHHLRSVVIAVRGTETAEDLITDGLGRECSLTTEDLDGLINCSHIPFDVRESVALSFPHYGHLGVVETARELHTQIEENPEDKEAGSDGFLSSLLGTGCECDGYSLYVVGHSLGGAIATLLGLRLHRRYPNLHVFAFGPLPCVDSVVAEACSEFVTSIVHDNEFSARLSVGSILRLRAAALMALSEDSNADTALIGRLARRFLYISNWQLERHKVKNSSGSHSLTTPHENLNYEVYGGSNTSSNEIPLWKEQETSSIDDETFENPFHNEPPVSNQLDNPVSQFFRTVSRSNSWSAGDPTEMCLPGLVIHLVPKGRNRTLPLWRSWRSQETGLNYNAYIANKEDFKDIIVSPNMFFDHLPWRCRDVMQQILAARIEKSQIDAGQLL